MTSSPGVFTESSRSTLRTPSRSKSTNGMARSPLADPLQDSSQRAQHRISGAGHRQESGNDRQQSQGRPLPGSQRQFAGAQARQPALSRQEDTGRRRGADDAAQQAAGQRMALELPGDIAVMGADQMQDLDDAAVVGEAGARHED